MSGEFGELGGGHVQFDHPAPARPGSAVGAPAGDPGPQQVAAGVGDGVAPFPAALGCRERAGGLGGDRAPARDLPGVAIPAQQCAQRDPQLHTRRPPGWLLRRLRRVLRLIGTGQQVADDLVAGEVLPPAVQQPEVDVGPHGANRRACSCESCRALARGTSTRSFPARVRISIPSRSAANSGPGAISASPSGINCRCMIRILSTNTDNSRHW